MGERLAGETWRLCCMPNAFRNRRDAVGAHSYLRPYLGARGKGSKRCRENEPMANVLNHTVGTGCQGNIAWREQGLALSSLER